jgi:uncharacterized protein
VASETGAHRSSVSVVLPCASAIGRLSPIGSRDVTLDGGLWADRARTNRERSIGHGHAELDRVGNLANLRMAVGQPGRYRALSEPLGVIYPFLDTDVYKWLEAVGWELGQAPDPELARAADEVIDLVAAAQRPDGYLNSYVQVVAGGEAYRDLAWGHELYCVGHLVQAAVAWHRALGDDRLLDIAVRAVESVERELGPGKRDAIDGHPEVEMSLVELYRTTGDQRHLDLAARLIDLRGHGLLGPGRFGSAYWQDHAPVREAATVAGHAVRQLYLDCGAVDVAVELGDEALLDAVVRRWRDMVATRSYLTGGVGSRHSDEAFGDPFELPPDRAYAETCAAIASVMLAWRLLLATGDPDCADVIERTMLNGVLSGVSVEGTGFFYVNPLQRRTNGTAASAVSAGDGRRQPWYPCACCPPNVMRTLSSWPHYLATADEGGIQLHQYASASIRADVAGGTVRLAVETEYPWSGEIAVTVRETPDRPWALLMRIPAWTRSATLRIGSDEPTDVPDGTRTIVETRDWRAGDRIVLTLDMPVRVTEPDPRIDAVRGCVALERGPIVFCVESADLPAGTDLEAIEVSPSVTPTVVPRHDIPGAPLGVTLPATDTATGAQIQIGAVPYFAWAHRTPGAMRVWIPTRTADRGGPPTD